MIKKLPDIIKSLPFDYGVTKAKEDMREFARLVTEALEEPELKPEFIKTMEETEKLKNILLKDIEDLFKK